MECLFAFDTAAAPVGRFLRRTSSNRAATASDESDVQQGRISIRNGEAVGVNPFDEPQAKRGTSPAGNRSDAPPGSYAAKLVTRIPHLLYSFEMSSSSRGPIQAFVSSASLAWAPASSPSFFWASIRP